METHDLVPMSRAALLHFTRMIRRKLGISPTEPFVDIMRILEHVLPQLFPDFTLEILPREDMGQDHGLTSTISSDLATSAAVSICNGCIAASCGTDSVTWASASLGSCHLIFRVSFSAGSACSTGSCSSSEKRSRGAARESGVCTLIHQPSGCNILRNPGLPAKLLGTAPRRRIEAGSTQGSISARVSFSLLL